MHVHPFHPFSTLFLILWGKSPMGSCSDFLSAESPSPPSSPSPDRPAEPVRRPPSVPRRPELGQWLAELRDVAHLRRVGGRWWHQRLAMKRPLIPCQSLLPNSETSDRKYAQNVPEVGPPLMAHPGTDSLGPTVPALTASGKIWWPVANMI